MNITSVVLHPTVGMIVLHGSLTHDTSKMRLDRATATMAAAGCRHLVLDCRDVEAANEGSTALENLAQAWKQRGGRVAAWRWPTSRPLTGTPSLHVSPSLAAAIVSLFEDENERRAETAYSAA